MQPHVLASPKHRLTVEQWFSNPFVQTLATSESFGWNNVTVRNAELNPTVDYYPTPYGNADTLVLVLRGSTCIEGHIAGRFFNKQVAAGALMTYPRHNEQLDGRWDSSVTGLLLELSREGIVASAGSTVRGDPERVEIQLSIGFYDPLLRNLATELHNELQSRNLFGPLFADSVANTIVLHLLRKYSNISTFYQVSGSKLTPVQQRIVEEYIHEQLDRKITLADLADCIHVSVPHFEKMFRATFRCPPYRYVLECRIEKAKLLLSNSQLSLYDIARQCGFANQSHFTKHFTRFVGVSPARLMGDVRNKGDEICED